MCEDLKMKRIFSDNVKITFHSKVSLLALTYPINFDFRQVIIVLTQLEGSGGFSIAHRLTHRLSLHAGLYDWGPQGTLHMPNLDSKVDGLHAPRPL